MIIVSFTNIEQLYLALIYNDFYYSYFTRSYIYPLIDPVSNIFKISSLLKVVKKGCFQLAFGRRHSPEKVDQEHPSLFSIDNKA